MDDQQRARELFEKWAESSGKTVHGFNRIEDMWEAWQAALRAAPEGWALVPVDLRTACDMWEAGIRIRNMGGGVLKMWEAMLAARPQGVKDAQ